MYYIITQKLNRCYGVCGMTKHKFVCCAHDHHHSDCVQYFVSCEIINLLDEAWNKVNTQHAFLLLLFDIRVVFACMVFVIANIVHGSTNKVRRYR